MKCFIVDSFNEGQRLNKYCARILKEAPQSFIYRMLRKKNITLNGRKAAGNEILSKGDEIKFFLADDTFDKFSSDVVGENNVGKTDVNRDKNNKEIKPLSSGEIIYENTDVILVFKKAGELSQKAESGDVSINERIIAYCSEKKGDGLYKPGVANRLDRNTAGIITAGKTLKGSRFLTCLFKERKIGKYYLAIVNGNFTDEIDMKLYLVKDRERNTVSLNREKSEGAEEIHNIFYPISIGRNCSLIKIKLETGKTHQIRAHLAYLGFPIVGDKKYYTDGKDMISEKYHLRYQQLLAYEIIFPVFDAEFSDLSGKSFKSSIPDKMKRIIEGEGLWLPGNQED